MQQQQQQPFISFSSFLNCIEAHLNGNRIDSIPREIPFGSKYCVNAMWENDAQKPTITVIKCISMCEAMCDSIQNISEFMH